MENVTKDERFSHIAKDPRFRSVPKKQRKVVVDKRFQSMFHDKSFKLQYAMDKRGRKHVHSTTEDLKKFYDLESPDEESANETEHSKDDVEPKSQIKTLQIEASTRDAKTKTLSPKKAQKKALELEEDDEESSENELSEKEIDLARGEGNVETSSSDDDDESDDNEGSEGELDHRWGELDADAPQTDDFTRRLAVCNMNWDRIKADDLFILVNSFKPLEGNVASVKIYLSDYGRERKKIEEMKGPAELVEHAPDVGDQSENPEGTKFHMERLRKYQLNRLKYYYAVVDCDSPETANKIYEELDGMEYESSATQVDLRFIPDDIVFDQEPTTATYQMPDTTKYEANIFTTTALQQAKVELTWDETDPDRIKTMQKAFQEADNVDLKAYLASSSEDESDNASEDDAQSEKTNPKSQIEKYKDLLASIEEDERKKKERDIDMQITWEPGLKEKTDNLIKIKQVQELTPFEEFLEKKKEKKKQKKKDRKDEKESNSDGAFSDDDVPSDVDLNNPYFKEEFGDVTDKSAKKNKKKQFKREQISDDEDKKAELELLLMDEEDGRKHFNLQDLVDDAQETKKRKRKKLLRKRNDKEVKKVDEFEVDTSDPRFAALYSSPLFNIDPSDPHFKKTKGISAIIEEKQKKRHSLPIDVHPAKKSLRDEGDLSTNRNPALSMLVKSVKSKTERFRRKD